MRLPLSRALAAVTVAMLGLGLAACGPRISNDDDDDHAGDDDDDDDDDDLVDAGPGDSCETNDVRCVGLSYQWCEAGIFEEHVLCETACAVALGGCVDCIPADGDACNGNAVHACNADGSFGELVDACGPSQSCAAGTCGDSACSGASADLIYVVDQTNRLLSFDPLAVPPADPFAQIGTLSCSLTGATPFSMAVDRSGIAWVLYNDGQIFQVSTEDASCAPSGFAANQLTADGVSWSTFGMAFVSDAAGSDDETLFITAAATPSHLGSIDPTTLAITSLEELEGGFEFTPELTGTGDGELYGYYPGATTTFIAELDKTTALRGTTWNLPGLGGAVNGWAFAHFGGRFYVFVTVDGNSQVLLVDPTMDGETTTLLSGLPYVIVGAGVSTCVPVVIP